MREPIRKLLAASKEILRSFGVHIAFHWPAEFISARLYALAVSVVSLISAYLIEANEIKTWSVLEVVRQQDWVELGRGAIWVCGLIFILFYVFLVPYRIFSYYRNREKQIKENADIVSGLGLIKYFPADDDRRLNNWEYCANLIQTASPDLLRVMCITGWETFGSESAPLRSTVGAFTGDLEILLVDPKCPGFNRRIKDLSWDEKTGKERADRSAQLRVWLEQQFHQTEAFCRELAKKPPGLLRSIIVKASLELPVWKTIIFDDHMWAQYYAPRVPIEKAPAFLFQRISEGGFFLPLEIDFRRQWHAKGTRVIVSRRN